MGDASGGTSSSEMMDDVNLNGAANGGNNSSDDEVVIGEDEGLAENKNTINGTSISSTSFFSGLTSFGSMNGGTLNLEGEKASVSHDMGFFGFEAPDNEDLFGDRPLPEWVGWSEPSDIRVAGSSTNPFLDHDESDGNSSAKPQLSSPSPIANGESAVPPNGSPTRDFNNGSSDSNLKTTPVPSLFEEDVEFVGVELEGTEKAMEQALKEGIIGEAGPLKKNSSQKAPERENSEEDGTGSMKEFNDANYWRVDQEVAVLE